MAASEKKKISNANWDKKNMTTLGCRVRKEEAQAFKDYAARRGKTAHTVLKEYVTECIKEDEEEQKNILQREGK